MDFDIEKNHVFHIQCMMAVCKLQVRALKIIEAISYITVKVPRCIYDRDSKYKLHSTLKATSKYFILFKVKLYVYIIMLSVEMILQIKNIFHVMFEIYETNLTYHMILSF